MPIKAIALYPHPKDKKVFEEVYAKEHIPMAIKNLKGMTKLVISTLFDSPEAPGPFYKMAELYFPSKDALDACMSTEDAKRTAEHAFSISTGGPVVFLFAETETYEFDNAGKAVRI